MRKKPKFKNLSKFKVSIASFVIFVIIIIVGIRFYNQHDFDTDYNKISYSLAYKIELLKSKEINNDVVFEYIYKMYNNALHHSNIRDPNYIIYEHLADQNLEFYLLGLADCSNPKIEL